ncbi:nucleotidyl transferase AbiEii/AbiGii toxin family protein [Streptomyces sp. NBC_01236]|uniref:nucleotidyl transferase AbiEii/AbiGii toxin family protein n=1 Tax=Streptomyces sp. NBC_01236 TaxID=2903789 RepID=UPI002E13EBCE|nr:nucleotidyl transferase AbiEii/AbiGii toxin family protein [Streptomyces sp. NBC_01236]
MTWSVDGERWRIAHRAVLDHLLGLVVGSPLGDALVLRGSMVMPAWVGADAREPADLDWIIPRPLLVPVDPEHPYPYVEDVEVVQQWPEAADGADRYEIWKFEEFDTGGLRPVVPPEGLRWIIEAEPEDCPPHETLLDLVRERPVAAPGVVLHADAARNDGTWTYSEYDTPGIRLIVPWEAEGLPPGEVRLDFARDEWLPEPPVLTAIPRGDGTGPTVVRTAGRELSLAWKLLWLHADCATEGRAQAKDLYDAVLLAEAEATKLSPRLLRKVFRHEPGNTAAADALRLDAVALWSVDWEDFRADHPHVRGTAEEWLERLSRALEPVLGR